MVNRIIFTLFVSLLGNFCFSDENPPADSSLSKTSSQILFEHPKGSFTFFWGYNRDFFSRSNIHFSGPDYNFTLFNVAAKDQQEPFSLNNYVNPKWMWVPQYNYRLGYFLTDNLCLSLGLDHMKYVMVRDQQAKISGTVSANASQKYQGTYQNYPVILSTDFLQFEHTNGFNLLSWDAEYRQSLFWLFGKKINVSLYSGIGIAAMIPKTEVYVFEKGMDTRFHLAGYAVSATLGPRINFLKRFFISAQTRGGYVNLPSVLIKNDEPMRASHSVYFLEYYVVGGVYFRLKKSN